MNESDLLIILDRCHGINVGGKSSPDGKHQEWLWGNEFVNQLSHDLNMLQVNNVVYPLSAIVPLYKDKNGFWKEKLTPRKIEYNNLPYKYKLVLSFHNDADGSKLWTEQTGWSMWTNKNQDISDLLAKNYLLPTVKEFIPEVKLRRYEKKEPDNEANFTILMGNYAGILIEWLFQNNKKDIETLKDSSILKEAIIQFIMKIHLDFDKLKKDWKI